MKKYRKIGIPHYVTFVLALFLAYYYLSPFLERMIQAVENFNDKRKFRKLVNQHCAEFILALDKTNEIKDYDKSRSWASENLMFNIWEKPSHLGKGLPVGRMKCGSTAMIINRDGSDYKILSPYDGSIGWINEEKVLFTILQNPKTEQPCKSSI